MFNRKSRELRRQQDLHEAALAGILDSLHDGDLIEITWQPSEALVVSDTNGSLTMPAQGERTQKVTVRVEDGEISYGGTHWTAWLRSCGEDQTSAVKSIRILERARTGVLERRV